MLTVFLIIISPEKAKKKQYIEEEKSIWDTWCSDPTETIELLIDPNKKEREEEERIRREVKLSKKAWRKIRQERFKFLDGSNEEDLNFKSNGKTSNGI